MKSVLIILFLLFSTTIVVHSRKAWFLKHNMTCKYCLKKIFLTKFLPRLPHIASVVVDVDLNYKACKLDKRFLSFSIDTLEMMRKFRCVPLRMEKFNNLAKALKPAYLRIGGTPQDYLTLSTKTRKENAGKSYRSKRDKIRQVKETYNCTPYFENWKKMKPYTLPVFYFEEIAKFTSRNGLKLIFGLNEKQRKSHNRWNAKHARKIIRFAERNGYEVDWELGNEPNRYTKYGEKYAVTGEQLARDISKLRSLIKGKSSQVFGPDITQPNYKSLVFMEEFLTSRPHVDAVTYHQYYMHQTVSTLAAYLDPTYLSKLNEQMTWQRRLLKVTNTTSPLWLGETGSSSGGGARDLSDTYASGFLYLGKLGLASTHCHKVVIRQSFYGGYYGMLDPVTHNPLPDYWSALIFKKLVGDRVLDTNRVVESYFQVFSFCSRASRNDIVIMVINLNRNESVRFSIRSLEKKEVEAYVLTAPDNNLQSKMILLNGNILSLTKENTIPNIKGVKAKTPAFLPRSSYGFFVYKNVNAQGCM